MAICKMLSFTRWDELEPVLASIISADPEHRASMSSLIEAAACSGLLSPSSQAQALLLKVYANKMDTIQALAVLFSDMALAGSPAWTIRAEQNLPLLQYARSRSCGTVPDFASVTGETDPAAYEPGYLINALQGLADDAAADSDSMSCCASALFSGLADKCKSPAGIRVNELLDALLASWAIVCRFRSAYIVALECCKLMQTEEEGLQEVEAFRRAVVSAVCGWPV